MHKAGGGGSDGTAEFVKRNGMLRDGTTGAEGDEQRGYGCQLPLRATW